MDIIKEIKASFKNGSVLTKLIYINLFLFLGLGISFSIIYLMNGNLAKLTYWFDLPASISILIKKPWTIITYMFTHFKFLHLLFNVLVLYWFGKIFLQYLTQKQLLGVYLTGGIVGAAFFVIAYNIFPVFAPVAGISSAVGASASIMAIIFTLAILVPKHEIRLMLIGKVKIIYLAIIVAAIDIISIPYNNAGGHIAHIGGAAYGVVFALLYKDGKDISAWITKIFDAIINLF
ncbi:MAG: rhomboid family intramembrane serine protease, partial [Bacteroidales bacterium]|nr:rhomboid family intramembrane serine protease [Bacteroidales bacterium]